MKKIFFLLTSLMIAVFLSVVAFADTKTYTPPPQKGYVYIIVKVDEAGTRIIKTSVRWGKWSKSETWKNILGREGLVLRLKHKKADSWPLTIDTDGVIVKGPFQGNPPSEWKNPKYKQVKW